MKRQEKGARRGGEQIAERAGELLDPEQAGDWNQAMMELGATVCLPRNPQCLMCPLAAACKTRGEHKTAPRAPMVTRTVGHALVVRPAGESDEVLLEQRPATETVMPGMWQLPVLRKAALAERDLCMTVRHAIMQVNYKVNVRTVAEGRVPALTVAGGERRWVLLGELNALPLTGLTRKVLTRTKFLQTAERWAGAD